MNDNSFSPNDRELRPAEGAMPGVMTGVFLWMFFGLAVSAGAAWLTLNWAPIYNFVLGTQMGLVALIVVEFVLVIALSAALHKLSSGAAAALFFLYALVNGMTLSVIFLVYQIGTLLLAFLVTAGMFGFMAGYGALTKADLSGYKSFLMMGLFGIVIATVVNLLLRSDMLDMILCYAGVFVFVGLTAYDTQKIKRMLSAGYDAESEKKIQIHGALMLYLDFINIFLRLLRLFGRKSK